LARLWDIEEERVARVGGGRVKRVKRVIHPRADYGE
jgi:hypothetical protein